METQIFHHAKNIIFKQASKRNQNPSRYYNSVLANLKFQHNQGGKDIVFRFIIEYVT
jgi:hypothetical protein